MEEIYEVRENEKVIIWGTGKWARRCINDLVPGYEVIAFVESNRTKSTFLGKPVLEGGMWFIPRYWKV